MEIYTIGFTKKTAQQFFEALKGASIEQLIDVRLNNISQLAGFSKRDDLEYFLREICNVDYIHEPMLAPTQEMLDQYKKSNEVPVVLEDEEFDDGPHIDDAAYISAHNDDEIAELEGEEGEAELDESSEEETSVEEDEFAEGGLEED